MNPKKVKINLILGILFLLPVSFLLLLYPAQHHYNSLEIVNENVAELHGFTSESDAEIILKDHITVLGFLGHHPLKQSIAALNLKELVYDKFKGFKKFQIVIVLPYGTKAEVALLKKEISSYEDLKFWHFVYGDSLAINNVYNSLDHLTPLDNTLATKSVFIVDKDLNQRGRLDDRSDNEIAKKLPEYPLKSYNCIEVAEIKNKMSEDVRVLFTEYRQKRKGNFDSSTRRANELKGIHDEEN